MYGDPNKVIPILAIILLCPVSGWLFIRGIKDGETWRRPFVAISPIKVRRDTNPFQFWATISAYGGVVVCGFIVVVATALGYF